eukprot:m.10232 g.10232  ORF g.10232 m.10232 type:complete len:325 (+) comp22051_c0_seq1:42-1016(+)
MKKLPNSLRSHISNVYAVDVALDGTVASCGDDGIIVWSQDGVKQLQIEQMQAKTNVSFVAGDRNRLISSSDTHIWLYDARTPSGRPVATWNENEEEINQISTNVSGEYAAACDDSGEIKIIDLRQNRLYRTLRRAHANICTSVQFHPTRHAQLVSGGLDAHVVLWDFVKARCLEKVSMVNGQNHGQFVNPPLVHSIGMHAGGEGVAAALGDSAVSWFHLGKRSVLHVCSLTDRHTASVSQVTFASQSRSGRKDILISGGNDGKIVRWDIGDLIMEKREVDSFESGELAWTQEHGSKINWLATSCAMPVLYVADQTSDVSVYELT